MSGSGTVKGNFKSNEKYPTPSIMQTFRNMSQTDWLYKAASYYDRAISYLQLYLRQALPRHETSSTNSISPSDLAGPRSATAGVRLTKWTLVASIVSDDQSLATAKNYQETPTLNETLEGRLRAQMRSIQCESWEAYLRGSIQLPNIDWNANQDLAPLTDSKAKGRRGRKGRCG